MPGDSTLTIEYYDTTTGTWETLAGPIAGPTIYSQQVPADISDVAGGVRFVYDYTGDDGGFAPGTDLSPSFTSSLRDDGRYVPGPPFRRRREHPDPELRADGCLEPDARCARRPGCPADGGLPRDRAASRRIPATRDLLDKAFGTSSSGGLKSVIARSGDTIPSTLNWSTGGYSNLSRVEVTDVASPETTPLASSIYNAFDLFRVEPITPATDPLIAYDAVQAVQLYNGTTWVTATNNPCTTLCVGPVPRDEPDRRASGHPRSRCASSSSRVPTVRPPRRAIPTAPPVGSGVARSFTNDRPIALTWQVRDTRRTDGTAGARRRAVQPRRPTAWCATPPTRPDSPPTAARRCSATPRTT